MRARGLRVARRDAETTRLRLREAGALRDDLRIAREPAHVVLPLRDDALPRPELGEVIEREFDPVGERPPKSYRDLVPVSPEERLELPRAFDVVGDIVLVRLPTGAEAKAPEVGAALLRFVPGARIVGLDRGVQGPERRRCVERIAGNGGWATRHRENGIEFSVDVEAAYFSPRLAREHLRVALDVAPGMSVYDLCCGVGPFALTIARRGVARRIVAVDSNASALGLLQQTLERSGWSGRVEPRRLGIEEFLPTASPVERVVFNLPREGIKYASSVGSVVAPAGRLAFYEVVERGTAESHAEKVIEALGGPGSWQLVDLHEVHPYSPAADLLSYTFVRRAT
jgi:tRNA (guanine37-N1)-methyltransferase